MLTTIYLNQKENAVNDIQLLTKAMNFAAQKHIDQRRKGEAAEPYLNHLTEVAALLAEFTKGTDPVVVAAGILHDTIEDTQTTREELVREFGENVADIVCEATDDKSLHWAERKRQQIIHAAHASAEAKQIKMADKISNLRAILNSPPKGWDAERKLNYFIWAKKVVDNCRGANAGLAACFDDIYQRGVKAFGPAA
jgi:guanosine-3',5'-bis(diphosphate) 3'-pyrophosphohydrolase